MHTEKTIVETDAAPAAVGPYSQAVKVGQLLFCSGQIPLVPESGELVNSDIRSAAEQVLRNLRAVLSAAGAQMADVTKTTVYISDMSDFAAMNEVYARHFGDSKPARACVEVSRLPRGALVEIDAIAIVG
jgi:2-iminobutanoate/2-iminopropanoate deaminase